MFNFASTVQNPKSQMAPGTSTWKYNQEACDNGISFYGRGTK
jgi:hypothetical protein